MLSKVIFPAKTKWTLICALVVSLIILLSLTVSPSVTSSVSSSLDLLKQFSNLLDKKEWKRKLTSESKAFRKSMQILPGKRSEGLAYEISDIAGIVPASARIRAKRLFNNKPLSIWTKDWKTTRVESLIELLKPFGVHFAIEFDPQECSHLDCKMDERLKVSKQLDDADLILCGQLSSTCEYFLKSGKNTLVLPGLSHYANHYSDEQLKQYNQRFAELASNPKNVFGSMNMFDAKLFHHLTGIESQLLPTMYDNVPTQYTNELDEFALLKSSHTEFFDEFYSNFTKDCLEIIYSLKVKTITVDLLREGRITHKYRAVIVIPDEVSMTSVLEIYHKNIPIFVPSPELLARWQVERQIIQGINLSSHSGRSRILPGSSLSRVLYSGPDGNDFERVLHWIKLTDFYQCLPHAIEYDSVKDLVYLMANVDDDYLSDISNKMQAYNVRFKKNLITKWRDLLLNYTRMAPYGEL